MTHQEVVVVGVVKRWWRAGRWLGMEDDGGSRREKGEGMEAEEREGGEGVYNRT